MSKSRTRDRDLILASMLGSLVFPPVVSSVELVPAPMLVAVALVAVVAGVVLLAIRRRSRARMVRDLRKIG